MVDLELRVYFVLVYFMYILLQIFPRYGGPEGVKYDRKFVYSR